MSKLLWLDDVRNPFEKEGEWLVFAPMRANEVIWVKDYNEFVAWITENGLPDGIAFDHDLADVIKCKEEKTGMDCAHWLVNYCLDNDKKLPIFGSHSANPPGRENIINLLTNFKKSQDD
jgi:hypothetical protein